MKKILLLGNIPNPNNTKTIGGANTYTFEILRGLSKTSSITVDFYQIRHRWNKFGQIIDYLLLFFKLPFKIYKYDYISIHATWDFHITIGPIAVLISKLFKKKIVYHFFGGRFHKIYNSYPKVFRWWLNKTIFKSDKILVETLEMKYFFENQGHKNMVWFPNSRKSSKNKIQAKNYQKRFVFVSRVTPTKGVDYLKEASSLLSKDYTLEIYGPLNDSYYNRESLKEYGYKGNLKPSKVLDTLLNFDVLILPTFHPGEGYPGIFIEAMSIGMPVICTNWNSLPEIIKHNKNGIVIPIKSSKAIVEAIEYFNEENYNDFSKTALRMFKKFNLETRISELEQFYNG